MIRRWDNAQQHFFFLQKPFCFAKAFTEKMLRRKPVLKEKIIVSDVLLEIKDIFRINDRSNQSHSKGVEG
jgi:hypothetical protein